MSSRRLNQYGLTLVELLIAMSIGLMILGSMLQILATTSDHYRKSESLALLHEQALVALRFMRDDLRLAGHWGALSGSKQIAGRALPADPNPATVLLPTRCAARIVTDLIISVELFDNASTLDCALAGITGSDALLVRFAASADSVPQAGQLQIYSTPIAGALISNGALPALPASPLAQLHDLQIMAYYVAPNSTLFPGQSALRRLTLRRLSNRPHFIDEEITAGVTDLQVLVAVDTDGDNLPDRQLAAGDPLLSARDADGSAPYNIVSVDLSLTLKGEADDLVVSVNETIFLRNGALL